MTPTGAPSEAPRHERKPMATTAHEAQEGSLYRPTKGRHPSTLYLQRLSQRHCEKLLREFDTWRRLRQHKAGISARKAAIVCQYGRDPSLVPYRLRVRVLDAYSGTKVEHSTIVLLPADYRLREIKRPPGWTR